MLGEGISKMDELIDTRGKGKRGGGDPAPGFSMTASVSGQGRENAKTFLEDNRRLLLRSRQGYRQSAGLLMGWLQANDTADGPADDAA